MLHSLTDKEKETWEADLAQIVWYIHITTHSKSPLDIWVTIYTMYDTHASLWIFCSVCQRRQTWWLTTGDAEKWGERMTKAYCIDNKKRRTCAKAMWLCSCRNSGEWGGPGILQSYCKNKIYAEEEQVSDIQCILSLERDEIGKTGIYIC